MTFKRGRASDYPTPEAIAGYFERNPKRTISDASKFFGITLFRFEIYVRRLFEEGKLKTLGIPRCYDLTKEKIKAIKRLIDAEGYPQTLRLVDVLRVSEFAARKLRAEYFKRFGAIQPPEPVGINVEPGDDSEPTVIREAWYVCDVITRGFPGMTLKRDDWSRYLALYEERRNKTIVEAYFGFNEEEDEEEVLE